MSPLATFEGSHCHTVFLDCLRYILSLVLRPFTVSFDDLSLLEKGLLFGAFLNFNVLPKRNLLFVQQCRDHTELCSSHSVLLMTDFSDFLIVTLLLLADLASEQGQVICFY